MQITNIELIPIYSTREMGRSLSFQFGEGNLPPHHRPTCKPMPVSQA